MIDNDTQELAFQDHDDFEKFVLENEKMFSKY